MAKKDYFNNLFVDIKNDTRNTWKVINNILKPENKTISEKPERILYENHLFDTNEEISTIFNSHFSTIGKKISESFQNIPTNKQLNNIRSPVNSFKFGYVTCHDVKSALLSLKNKSCHISLCIRYRF